MMMSAPVRVMRYGVMRVAPVQNMRPRVTRPTPYAASTTIVAVMTVVGMMMVGATAIPATAQQSPNEAAKLRQRGLRLQKGGDGQSEKAEQEGSA